MKRRYAKAKDDDVDDEYSKTAETTQWRGRNDWSNQKPEGDTGLNMKTKSSGANLNMYIMDETGLRLKSYVYLLQLTITQG